MTLFSASNYMSQTNRAGAALLYASTDVIDLEIVNLGLAPEWEQIKQAPLLMKHSFGAGSLGRDLLHDPQLLSLQQSPAGSAYNAELRHELVQQAASLLVEFRSKLWEACSARDPELRGVITEKEWVKVCRTVTNIEDLDWALLAKLVAGSGLGFVRYMVLLNRFEFRVEGAVQDPAQVAVRQVFLSVLRADEPVQQLCSRLVAPQDGNPKRRMTLVVQGEAEGGRAVATAELRTGFRALLARSRVEGVEADAVIRGVEAHIGQGGCEEHVSVAAFVSAWARTADCRAQLRLTISQEALADQLSALIGDKADEGMMPERLMDFFAASDSTREGYLSIADAQRAFGDLLRAGSSGIVVDEAELSGLLSAADITGRGRLNYLEFLLLLEHEDVKCLTHQSMLDALCFQVWAHRNALSGLFRCIASQGRVDRDQVTWALQALNKEVGGQLTDENISTVVNAVAFAEVSGGKPSVVAEEFLFAFDLVDSSELASRCRSPSGKFMARPPQSYQKA